ncbi:unnamed protein product [Orchesella dallaii]|uniref:Uncharacterized protein n=1 Tax=Orchesella dallaii TaxID=48710 RepID=A0ABP1RCW3_9HEXA
MPAMTTETDENPRPSFFRWFRCQCQKIRLVNDRLFIIAPMMAMGSSLSELVVVFSITGFTNLDMVAVSSVSLCLLLAFATLLFIRFDRLTLLAYLMLCVSFLSSSTFLVISYENQQTSEDSNNSMLSSSQSQSSEMNESIDFMGLDTISLAANTSRHGKKLFNLMKTETELRWIHQVQSSNKCCGYWNYTDWVDPNHLQDSNKTYVYFTTEPISPPPKWVTSCCDRTLNRDDNKCRSDSVYDDWKDAVQYLFPEGCGSLMDDELDRVQREMLKTSMALAFWDVLILFDVVVYTIWRKLRSHSLDCQRNGSNVRDCGAEEDDVFT